MKKLKISQETIDRLFDGLSIDGGHHKQYYIFQALVTIFGSKEKVYEVYAKDFNLTVEEYIKEYGEIDEGIPA